MRDTRKENGTEQLVGEQYQTNIIEFPIQIKMQRILREAIRLEKHSKYLVKKYNIR